MPNNTMKRNPAAGTGKVFWYTLKQMLCAKGWLLSTIIIAALLLLGIPALLYAMSSLSGDSQDKDDETVEIGYVCVVDETEGEADYSAIGGKDDENPPEYIKCGSMDDAISQAAGKKNAVILRVTKPETGFMLTVYLPQVTDITRGKASRYGSLAEERFSAVLMQKAELTPEGVMLLSLPVLSDTVAVGADAEETEDEGLAGELIRFCAPFMMMMLVYMMVVMYGQSMSNSVMLEKTSKLMETILTAVHPVALMTGKLFATATAAVIQLTIWICAAFAGTIGGAFFALRMIPETDNDTVQMITEVSKQATSISPIGVLVSVVFLALGFLLYLSLSSVAGAMASKTEDLNKTNVIYVLVIVGSMLLCMSQPNAAEAVDSSSASMVSDALWLKFFPFTAILVMPSELILGSVSAGVTVGSIACLVTGVLLLLAAAAAIYKMLVLYRGEPPKPKQLLAMWKDSRKKTENESQNN